MAEQKKTQQKSTQSTGTTAKKTQQKKSTQPPALRSVVDKTMKRINELQDWNALDIPEDYSPANAIRSASFIIQDLKDKNKKPVLEVCTRDSIMNSLLEMVVQGLNPMKRQCSFIPRGNKLVLQREYAGTLALAKRFGGVKFVNPVVIYENDGFEYRIEPETGFKIVTKHEQSLDNIDINKIKGGYCVVHFEGSDVPYTEIMTIKQIRTSWQQGEMKGNSPAHQNFTEEMVKKTLINRACKRFINASGDAPLLIRSEKQPDHQKQSVQEEISENENAEVMEEFDNGEQGEQKDQSQIQEGKEEEKKAEEDTQEGEPSQPEF